MRMCVYGWLLRLHRVNSECTCVNDTERAVVFGRPSGNEACCANCVTWRERGKKREKTNAAPPVTAADEPADADRSGFRR